MFERFTERARRVVVLAQEEAVRLRHGFIGTEHLLLGLVAEGEGVAAQVLASLDVTPGEAREQVEGIVGRGREAVSSMPFTPRSKKVMELALRESMRLNHNYIGTEHLLLGLLRESEGVAARVLSNLDVDPDEVRREVERRLGVEPEIDPVGRVEAEMESEEVGMRRTLFRGRVGGIQVETPSVGTLVVDLDYAYEVTEDPEGGLVTVNHDGIVGVVEGVLEASEALLPEQVAGMAGEYLLERVPEITEVSVVVSRPQVSGLGSVSGFSVSATFRR